MKLNYKVLTITIFIVAFILAGAFWSKAGGLGTYSTGYRFGQITKFSVKGLVMKSGEGQMLVGVESTPLTVTVKTKDSSYQEIINPWAFSSSDKQMHSKLNDMMGEYVILQYKQSHIKSPNVDTSYEITNVTAVSDEKLTESCQVIDFKDVWGSDDDTKLTQKSKGKLVGRFTKVSMKGTMVNSYETTIQQGNAGSQFKDLSIRQDAMYACAIKALSAGQKVKIYYIESHINFDIADRETPYDIVKIEPIKSFE